VALITGGNGITGSAIIEHLARNTSREDQKFDKAAPQEGQVQQEFALAEWAADKREVWDELCEDAGVPEAKASWDAGTWQYQDWLFQRAWSATLSFNKAREFGWTGHRDSYKSITHAFDQFRQAKQIP